MLVKLNVGGHVYWTTHDTLTSRGPNMLSSMVRHQNPGALVEDAYFIDRDPETFRWVLNYLRGSRTLPRKQSVEMYLLKEEAEYFAMDELVTRIQHLLCPSFNKGDSVLVRGSKFTILQQTGTGYVVTRCGKSFKLDASENIEPASVEIGDVVMAWYQPSHKRLAGICMAIQGKEYTIQFNGDIGQDTCPSTGVRF
ncbi:BTB/POZ domain-containing protein [bacterium]|nr:BTB/POZ domain-containing protein [bacterium]